MGDDFDEDFEAYDAADERGCQHGGGNRKWCPACQETVTTIAIDEGIGSYDYWGSTGVHEDWVEACPQCENTELLDEEPEEEDSDDDHSDAEEGLP